MAEESTNQKKKEVNYLSMSKDWQQRIQNEIESPNKWRQTCERNLYPKPFKIK